MALCLQDFNLEADRLGVINFVLGGTHVERGEVLVSAGASAKQTATSFPDLAATCDSFAARSTDTAGNSTLLLYSYPAWLTMEANDRLRPNVFPEI